MIIDIHAHTSTHRLWGLHTTSASIQTLEELAGLHEVVRTVVMATYFPFKNSGVYNYDMLQRIGDRKQFLMFASLDASADYAEGLKELQVLAEEKKIAGIKLYPGYQNFDPAADEFYGIYEVAEKFELPVAVHTGDLHRCCSKKVKQKCEICEIDRLQYLAEPLQMEKAIKDFPKVNFILAHLGNPYYSQTQELMYLYPNVYTDISGQHVSPLSTQNFEDVVVEVRKFLLIPGACDRVLFGTDYPIQSYEDSIRIVESLGVTAKAKQKIYYENAAKLLKLEN